nr:hypothetical protein [uncultured Enterobacter sp.]
MSTHNLKKIRLKTIKYLKKLACTLLKIFLALILYYLVSVAFVLFKIENYLWEPTPILIESKSVKQHAVIVKPLKITRGCHHTLVFEQVGTPTYAFKANIQLLIVNDKGLVRYSNKMTGYTRPLFGPVLEAGYYNVIFNVDSTDSTYPFEYFSLSLGYSKDGCGKPLIYAVSDQIKMLTTKPRGKK